MEKLKNTIKLNETRKTLKNARIVTFPDFNKKDNKQDKNELKTILNELVGTIKTNKNGDLYIPISNETCDKIIKNAYFYASETSLKRLQNANKMKLKMTISKALLEAYQTKEVYEAKTSTRTTLVEDFKMYAFATALTKIIAYVK